MAQSKINELEFGGGRGRGREGNWLSSTPSSGKGKPYLLLPQKRKFLLFLFPPRAFILSHYLGML